MQTQLKQTKSHKTAPHNTISCVETRSLETGSNLAIGSWRPLLKQLQITKTKNETAHIHKNVLRLDAGALLCH